MNTVKIILLILVLSWSMTGRLDATIDAGAEVDSIAVNVLQYIDLADLEYDDRPYPGRTNIGHILIPNMQIRAGALGLMFGGWYRQIFVQYSKDNPPERMYPFIAAQFFPDRNSRITLGNYENINPLPNTIFNEFLFFEQRPVSSGFKYHRKTNRSELAAYWDWIALDTREHPEEFITGITFDYHFDLAYIKLYNHYHHRGGQLNKDTHPVRLEQDVATSPMIGITYEKFFIEAGYYWSIFEQNFKASTYGHAASVQTGYRSANKTQLSYMCWYNYNYYHGDAHPFYNRPGNVLHRLQAQYHLLTVGQIANLYCDANLYGPKPPGIDFRIYGKINLDFIAYTRYKKE